MSRLTTLSQRNPQNQHPHSTPSPVLYPPSGSGPGSGFGPGSGSGAGLGSGYASGPSSGRISPYPNPHPNISRPPSNASQYSESPYGGGMASSYSANASVRDRDSHVLEGQNDDRLEGLLGKVKILKDITVGIGNEVRDSNVQLGNMNDTFSSTSNFLGGTFRRMNKMASKQGGNWCWFMGFLALCVWIFVVVWWLRR